VPDDLQLLAGGARAAWLLSMNNESAGLARRWREVARQHGPDAEVEAVGLLVRLAWEQNDEIALAEGLAALEQLADQLQPSERQAHALGLLAQTCMLTGRSTDALTWADRAFDVAEAVGAKGVRAQVLADKGTALAEFPSRRAEGEALLRAGIAEAEALGDDVLLTRGLFNLCHFVSLHTPAGRAVHDRWFEVAVRAGFDPVSSSRWSQRLVDVAMSDADMAAATEGLERVRRLADSDGVDLGWIAVVAALLARERGDVVEARACLAEVPKTWRFKNQGWLPQTQLLLAELEGDRAAGQAAYAAFAAAPHGFRVEWGESIVESVMAALWLDVPVDRVQADVADRSDLFGLPWWPVVDALLLDARGHREQAIEPMEAALALGGDIALPKPLRARLETRLAQWLVAVGRRDDAVVHAHRAVDLLALWPGPSRNEALGVLRRLEASSLLLDGGPAELTTREREVAALLAEGCSNAELARRLFISPKTAAVHVSNILAKLGMSGRAEIAAWAVRHGLTAG
jgi:DNA-binding CsgD family transcriptional regulator